MSMCGHPHLDVRAAVDNNFDRTAGFVIGPQGANLRHKAPHGTTFVAKFLNHFDLFFGFKSPSSHSISSSVSSACAGARWAEDRLDLQGKLSAHGGQREVSMVPARSIGRNKRRRSVDDPEEMAREVAGLSALTTKTLKQRWLSLGGAGPPPGLGRSLLVRVIAYRIQERAFGGLKPATRRFLNQFSDDAGTGRPPHARPSRTATPGTVLVRAWHGTSHRVTVLDQGCTWRGTRYRSLSAVARAITGVRWSGPRFFGLGQAEQARRNGTRDA